MRIVKYTKINAIFIAIMLLIFIFSSVNLAYETLQNRTKEQEEHYKKISIKEMEEETDEEEKIEEKLKDMANIKEQMWQIEIPVIDLIAPIEEGTTQEIMLKNVGHFENTKFWKGNIGLAAHNRGYPINYFEKVKDLEPGDEIIYKTPYGEKVYEVTMYKIIDQTDWSYLEETSDNRITLITCVRNKPEQRLCVQAREKI